MKADPFKIPSNQAGLYIHIPFCLSKCGYCSFYSIKSLNLIPEFIDALNIEIKFYRKLFKSFDTIYLGGGTPSLLTQHQLAEIFTAINKYYKIDKNAEITHRGQSGRYFSGILENNTRHRASIV